MSRFMQTAITERVRQRRITAFSRATYSRVPYSNHPHITHLTTEFLHARHSVTNPPGNCRQIHFFSNPQVGWGAFLITFTLFTPKIHKKPCRPRATNELRSPPANANSQPSRGCAPATPSCSWHARGPMLLSLFSFTFAFVYAYHIADTGALNYSPKVHEHAHEHGTCGYEIAAAQRVQPDAHLQGDRDPLTPRVAHGSITTIQLPGVLNNHDQIHDGKRDFSLPHCPYQERDKCHVDEDLLNYGQEVIESHRLVFTTGRGQVRQRVQAGEDDE